MVLEMWMCVDTNGDYGAGRDADEARASYTENIGALEDVDGFRLVKVSVDVPLPVVAEMTGTAPALGEVGNLVVK